MFRTILGSDQLNSGKYTEISKQSHVNFWFDKRIWSYLIFTYLVVTVRLFDRKQKWGSRKTTNIFLFDE